MKLAFLNLLGILGNLIQNAIFLAILAIPWLFTFQKPRQKTNQRTRYKKVAKFIRVNLLSLPLIFALLVLLAYWPHFYRDLRLALIGFDFHGLNHAERVQNVAPELQTLAANLYASGMGIGWTLEAIIGIIVFSPYPSIVITLQALTKHLVKTAFNIK